MRVEVVEPGSSIKRIESQLWLLDSIFLPPLSERVNIKEYAGKLSQKAYIVYAREKEDLGHCAIYINEGGMAFISSFGVRKEFHCNNIGSLMMQKVKEICLRMHCKEIVLEAYKENGRAVYFYQKHEFEIFEESMKWYKMRCELKKRFANELV